MKKTINVTIEKEDWDWLRANHINISAYIRALIIKKRNEDIVNNPKEEFLTKEESLILNG